MWRKYFLFLCVLNYLASACLNFHSDNNKQNIGIILKKLFTLFAYRTIQKALSILADVLNTKWQLEQMQSMIKKMDWTWNFLSCSIFAGDLKHFSLLWQCLFSKKIILLNYEVCCLFLKQKSSYTDGFKTRLL